MLIDRDSRVTLHYELRLTDGLLADATPEGEPLHFQMGDGTLMPLLEDCLIGLPEGEATRILLPPDEGFGHRSTDNIHVMPREDFPEDFRPEPGQVIDFSTPTGESVPGIVLAVESDEVTVDFNHPLSGHVVQFIVKVLKVEPSGEAGEPA
ncbi:MAG: FKBP-type peptidyl-prolyl cis-trans isomerase [Halothiobacillaceae bacterium]|nr:FKBP-type peptidyl-prolyl cis-trans isomerase [Halothiobacillaceae bacterium]